MQPCDPERGATGGDQEPAGIDPRDSAEAEVGERFIREWISHGDFVTLLDNLRKVDKRQNSTSMGLHGKRLPRNKWSPNVVQNLQSGSMLG
jgi:hypothetical protein